MAVPGFHIVAKFAFDPIAERSILSMEQRLQGISNAADIAINKVSSLGLRFILSFSGGAGGILGLLGKAIQASDTFTNAQLDLFNVLAANKRFFPGLDEDNKRLGASQKMIQEIVQDARKFSLPEQELFGTFKSILPALAPKGLAGPGGKMARDISRNLLKSASNLSINPGFIQNQLIDMIQGRVSGQGMLFDRLLLEVPEVFKEFGIKTAKQFNTLEASKRVNLLNKSLEKFSSNTYVLTKRANTLAGLLNKFKSTFGGMQSVLKPIGDLIMKLIVPLANDLLDFINTRGAKIVKKMTDLIGSLIESPRKFIVDLMQLRHLSTDAGGAAKYTGLILLLINLQEFVSFISGKNFLTKTEAFQNVKAFFYGLGYRVPILGKVARGFRGIFRWMTRFIGGSGSFSSIGGVVKLFGRLSFYFAGFLIIFQAWSRAMEKLKIESLLKATKKTDEYLEVVARIFNGIRNILGPFQTIVEGLADLIVVMAGSGDEPIGRMMKVATAISWILHAIGNAINFFEAVLRSFIAGVLQTLISFGQLLFGGVSAKYSSWSALWSIISGSIVEEWNKVRRKIILSDEDREKAKFHLEQNNDIKIIQDFKDKQNPDRIAFRIKDVLESVANNPTQAARSPGFTGAVRGLN